MITETVDFEMNQLEPLAREESYSNSEVQSVYLPLSPLHHTSMRKFGSVLYGTAASTSHLKEINVPV